ncbi:peptidylprolyl isomerase [Caldovatus aquaticus]|uniref:Parvulin-like PPIase n=1 Tax=Caldovatus aquaticus TaxID=2865671 RepID=A0ABS7F0N0_9PROT|nr:peptidylprolyl isomerase [Caldovatus aquaticus]MBW8269114.1 SurA N-terminal domain-containing protein [Caldovatus aquaticus]
MLTALRRLAGTWVARALFIVLVFSFAIWGIGDMVRNFGRDTAVARVAGEPIALEEAQLAVRREVQRLARQLGPNFEADEAVRRAVAAQAVEGLIAERALRAEARRMSVVVPEEAVREFVWTIPALQGADGRFSRPLFEGFLRQNGLTEAEFLRLVRSDLARQQLVGAVRARPAAPDALTRPLYAFEAERRVADLVLLPLAAAPEPEPPTEAQLRRFHENNPDRFSAPEYREATVAVLTADQLLDQVAVSEEELAEAYEARRAQFETPERRRLRQALVPSEEAARAIAEAWRGGAGWEAIEARAREAGGQAIAFPEPLDRAGLPVPELAEAAFATPEGGITDPVRSPFGWHVLRVDKVEPAQARGLDEVRDALRREIAHEKAVDLVFARASRIEDALASGAPLVEVAPRFGMAVATVATDAAGRTPAGEPVTLPIRDTARAELLRRIFAARPGDAPRLEELQDGFTAVEVKTVTPPALRPFETVEDQVRRAWTAEARRRAQEERAAALLAAVRGGKSLAEAAREAGLEARGDRIGPFPRQPGPGNPAPPELLAPIFEARPGEATMVETRDGFAVAQLVEVMPANPDADPLGLGRIRDQVEQAMTEDLEQQYLVALRHRADVRINAGLMEQVAR